MEWTVKVTSPTGSWYLEVVQAGSEWELEEQMDAREDVYEWNLVGEGVPVLFEGWPA